MHERGLFLFPEFTNVLFYLGNHWRNTGALIDRRPSQTQRRAFWSIKSISLICVLESGWSICTDEPIQPTIRTRISQGRQLLQELAYFSLLIRERGKKRKRNPNPILIYVLTRIRVNLDTTTTASVVITQMGNPIFMVHN